MVKTKFVAILTAAVLSVGLASCGSSEIESIVNSYLNSNSSTTAVSSQTSAVSSSTAASSVASTASSVADTKLADSEKATLIDNIVSAYNKGEVKTPVEKNGYKVALETGAKINGSVSLTSTNKFVTSESESGAGTVTSTGDANLVLVSGASAAASLVKNAAGTYEAVAQADASAEGAAHVEGELFGEMIGGLTHQEEMMSIVENGLDLEGSAYANAAAAVTDKTYFNGKAGYTYLVKANQTPVDVGADDTTSSVAAEPTVFDTTFAGYGSQTMNDYPTYLLTKIGMTTDQIKAAITKIPAINATEDQLSQFKMILSMAMNLYTVDAYVDSVSGDVTFKGSLSSQNIENIKEFPVLEMVGLILQSEVNSGKLSDSTAAVASALIEKLHNMDNKSKMTLPDTAKLNLEVKLNADYFPVSLSYDVDLTGFNELIDLTYTAPTTDENSSEVVVDGPLSSKLSGNIGFERFIASGSLDFTYGDDIEPLTFSAEDKAAALAGTDYSEAIESYFAPKKDVPIAQ